MKLNTVYNTDCLVGLKELPDNFCHSIITDPPYELNFMGKKWDRTKISYSPELWSECLRVLRPGGYLLSFVATRTYHRIACAIEDAGFEIRDLIDSFYDNGQDIINFLDSLSPEQAEAFSRLLGNRMSVGFLSWIYGQGLPKSQEVAKAIDKKLGVYKKIPKFPTSQ